MRSGRPILSALLLALSVVAPLAAQQHPNHERGFTAEKAYSVGDVDHVNLYNGNLTLTIPIGQRYKVNALEYGLTLVYNSNVWDLRSRFINPDFAYTEARINRRSNAGAGWMLTLAFQPDNFSGTWLYVSPDGGEHIFYPKLHEGDSDTTAGESTTWYTRDGTYLRLKDFGNFQEIETPTGEIHKFLAGSPLLNEIRDRFGNWMRVAPGSADPPACTTTCWRLTDSVGRAHNIEYTTVNVDNRLVQMVSKVNLAAFGGARAIYTFTQTSTQIARACEEPANDPLTGDPVSVPLLTEVKLPDDSTYSMPVADYHVSNQPSPVCDISGRLKAMRLPTWGRIEWTYGNYTFPTNATDKPWATSSRGVFTRRMVRPNGAIEGTWSYTPFLQFEPPIVGGGPPQTNQLTNTVVDPLGHKTIHYFSVYPYTSGGPQGQTSLEYGLPFSRKVTDGAGRFLSSQFFETTSAPSALRATYLRYEADQPPAGMTLDHSLTELQNLNRRQASQRTIFNDDGGNSAAETLSDFDGLGHYRSRATNGTFPGNNVKTSFTGYNPDRNTYGTGTFSMLPATSDWVINTYTFSWDSEGGQLLYRSFCFNALGFLLGRRVHLANNASYRTNDVVEVLTDAGFGNVGSEKHFGGDVQNNIPTGASDGFICALTTSLTNPTYQVNHEHSNGARSRSFYNVDGVQLNVLDLTIDPSTGLPSASRDSAGAQTSFSFDTLSRISFLTQPEGAVTGYTYQRALSAASLAQVTVSTDFGTNMGLSRHSYDGFGRLTLDEERMPNNNWSGRAITYNALGWKTFVSERGTPGSGTTFVTFDAFGRPTRIRPADGAAHDVTLSYAGTRQVTRTSTVATGASEPTRPPPRSTTASAVSSRSPSPPASSRATATTPRTA